MTWRIAKSLGVLRDQVNAAHPSRDKSSDGSIGDARHSATKSEHNPDANGVVRAIDVTHDPANGVNGRGIAEALIASRDPRILYVISNGEICSSVTVPWVWRKYSGSNGHFHHVHISVVEKPALYDDTRQWSFGGGKAIPVEPVHDAAWLQGRLNELGANPRLVPDGDIGAKTIKEIEKYLPPEE